MGSHLPDDPTPDLQFQGGREIVRFSTNEPERLVGISGPNVRVVPDVLGFLEVSILSRPEERLQHAISGWHIYLQGVSILSRPEERLQPEAQATRKSRLKSFNPQPPRRAAATLLHA